MRQNQERGQTLQERPKDPAHLEPCDEQHPSFLAKTQCKEPQSRAQGDGYYAQETVLRTLY